MKMKASCKDRRSKRGAVRVLGCTLAALTHLALAADRPPPSVDIATLRRVILDESPSTRVEQVDHQRLVVRRIDVVDEQGVVRLSLAAPTDPPIVDGIRYRRAFPVSGLTIFDREGNERGGLGVADIAGAAAVIAMDHANGDAIGWRVMPDGSVVFRMNQRAPLQRAAELGDRLVPSLTSVARLRFEVAADGTPAIALADREDRVRLRLTVTEAGHGAIEFLDAQGRSVGRFAPEAEAIERSSAADSRRHSVLDREGVGG